VGSTSGIGVALYKGKADGESSGDRDNLEIHVQRSVLRFDWTAARHLLLEVSELADEACRWMSGTDELRDLLTRLFGIASQIQTAVGRENRQTKPEHDESHQPGPQMASDCAIIGPQLTRAREHFNRETQRAAQVRYAEGMGIGAALIAVLYGVTEMILALNGIPAVNAIGVISGAAGACVSVLRRMSRGTLSLDAQIGDGMLLGFGVVRPILGAVFGMVVYLVIRAELISIFTLPSTPSAALAYIFVFTFVAGFSERFAQDVLANATNTRTED
jgi:hypothetical protein